MSTRRRAIHLLPYATNMPLTPCFPHLEYIFCLQYKYSNSADTKLQRVCCVAATMSSTHPPMAPGLRACALCFHSQSPLLSFTAPAHEKCTICTHHDGWQAPAPFLCLALSFDAGVAESSRFSLFRTLAGASFHSKLKGKKEP
eukprot:6184866-Pleurochrysis_carterae.AAC.2